MIKFLFLLPFKIIGVIFLTIGAVLDNSNRRRIEKEKREQARLDRQAQADRRRAEKEKQAQAVKAQKAAQRRKAETFKADQARTDIEHYKIQRTELLKLYSELEKQYEQAATDSKKEIAFRKMIALNNQTRGVDRQIETAQYTINKSGPA